MDFKQVEAEFNRLKKQFEAGDLTEADFKSKLEDLMIQDEGGHWWMIGYETGAWYRNDGSSWVMANPPGHEPQKAAAAPKVGPKSSSRLGITIGGIALLILVGGIGGFALLNTVFRKAPPAAPVATFTETPDARHTSVPTNTKTLIPTLTEAPTATKTLISTLTKAPQKASTPIAKQSLDDIAKELKVVLQGKGIPEAATYNQNGVGPHTIVLLLEDGTLLGWNNNLEQEWKPEKISDVELVASFTYFQTTVASAQYTGCGKSGFWYLYRIRRDTKVFLMEAKTGTVVSNTIFEGGDPPGFDNSTKCSVSGFYGDEVQYETVIDWLRGYLQ